VDTDDDDDDEEEEADVKLQRIQEAYEVLKDDSTRLLYHKYGLIHTNMAAFLLTGGTYHHLGKATATPWILSPEQCQLLQLMGYYNLVPCNRTSSSSISATWSSHHHQDRILFLATQLVERIRPWMEGTISSSTLADVVATECDQLKHLPLGAQILRCIGRAYRHAGGKVLRRYARKRNCDSMLRKKENHHPLERRLLFVPNRMEEKIHDGLRHAKHLMTAAVASGRVVLSERIMEATTPSPKFKSNGAVTIEYQGEQEDEYNHDDFLLLGPASDHTSPSQEEMQHKERRKAQEAMLQALQVEALWKISKIELDRTIQEACELILSGTYFFFPSHQVPPPPPPPPPSTVPPPPIPKREQYGDHHHDVGDYDGWVGAAGTTVNTNVGILRAAEALALIGDVMVRCSKQGTAWME
jgi:curved DNA-binding protein CbpA